MKYGIAKGSYHYDNYETHEYYLVYKRKITWMLEEEWGVFDTRVEAMRFWLFIMKEIPDLNHGDDEFIKRLFKPFTYQKMAKVMKVRENG